MNKYNNVICQLLTVSLTLFITLPASSIVSNSSENQWYDLQRKTFPRKQFGKVNLYSKNAIQKWVKGKPFSQMRLKSPESPQRLLARPIGRLDVLTKDAMYTCTAFLFHGSFLMTNEHCIDGNPQKIVFRLGYAFEGNPQKSRSYDVQTQPLEVNKKHDYAILQIVSGRPEDYAHTLKLSTIEIVSGQKLILIGHPSGMPQMQSGPEDCKIVNTTTQTIERSDGSNVIGVNYNCSSIGGNSGSPVLDKLTGEVVALNHSSNRLLSWGTPISDLAKISPIVRDIVSARVARKKKCFYFNRKKICNGSAQLSLRAEKSERGIVTIDVPFRIRSCVRGVCFKWRIVNKRERFQVQRDGSIHWVNRKLEFPRFGSTIKYDAGNQTYSAMLSKKGNKYKFTTISDGDPPIRSTVTFEMDGLDCKFKTFKVRGAGKGVEIQNLKPQYCVVIN